MSPIRTALVAIFAALAGCQTAADFAGPPLPLPPDLASDARIFHRDVLLDPNHLDRFDPERDAEGQKLIATLRTEVGDQLGRCANGKRKLILDTYVTEVRKRMPLNRLLKRGVHRMHVIAKFTDAATKQVVGRYPIDVSVDSGNFGTALLSDADLMLAEALGQELCRTLRLSR